MNTRIIYDNIKTNIYRFEKDIDDGVGAKVDVYNILNEFSAV